MHDYKITLKHSRASQSPAKIVHGGLDGITDSKSILKVLQVCSLEMSIDEVTTLNANVMSIGV